MQHQKYPRYKVSGAVLLGDIPEHWQLRRLRFSAPLQNHKSTTKSDELPYIGLEHIESGTGKLLDISNTSEVESTVSLFQTGDVLFNKLRPYLAKVYLAKYPGTCTSELLVLRPAQDIWSRFLFYYLLSDPIIRTVDSFTYGAKMPRVNWEQIADLPVAVATLSEQQAIVDFLDRETAIIDTLIAKKQQLIQVLQKQRMALISHAVTKGLDPHVRMKDSGIEWLRGIPVHWYKMRIKFLLHNMIDTEHKTAPFYLDGEYLVVRTSNVRNGKLIFEDAKYTDRIGYEIWTKRGKPKPGDILFTREAPAGEACVVPDQMNLCLGQRMVLFSVDNRKLDSEFGVYAIYGGIANEFINGLSQGSTVAHFNMSDIGNIPLLVPPLDEQRIIVKSLNNATRDIDALISKVSNGIKKLQEYRTTLISSTVTGKIDVRTR